MPDESYDTPGTMTRATPRKAAADDASDASSEATRLLHQLTSNNRAEITNKLLPLVYDELRALAGSYFKRERSGHTLQPTALVHEAFMKLVDQSQVSWQGRTHFFAVCAEAMRRILIDHARTRRRIKRGGDRRQVAMEHASAVFGVEEFDYVAFNDALERLRALDERQYRIVELRFFAGMTVEEVARAMDVSKRTVESEWTHAKAWLKAELGE